MVVVHGILIKMGDRYPRNGNGIYYKCTTYMFILRHMFWVDVVTWILSIVYHQQMRPDIKSDVFHLNWAPESVPADEVLMTTNISHV